MRCEDVTLGHVGRASLSGGMNVNGIIFFVKKRESAGLELHDKGELLSLPHLHLGEERKD